MTLFAVTITATLGTHTATIEDADNLIGCVATASGIAILGERPGGGSVTATFVVVGSGGTVPAGGQLIGTAAPTISGTVTPVAVYRA